MPTELRLQKETEKKLRTRKKLLDAALFEFKREGYHNTLISNVVNKAGVGQGTFYRYFSDKADIFESLLQVFTDSLMDEFSDMSENLPKNAEEYRASSVESLERMARIIEEHRDIFYLFLKEAPSVNKEFEETIELILNRFAGLAKYYLDHAIKNGFARECRSDVVSQSIVGIALRMMDIWWSNPFNNTSLKEMIVEAVDLAFDGLIIKDNQSNEGKI